MAVNPLQERIKRLEEHLQQENPVLAGCVQSFRKLDAAAQALGLQDDSVSYANQVPWWPVVSILGTFSAGKSTFINQYIGRELQRTGNQAVDDKFTVICYGEGAPVALPGIALDNDPRFPLYKISQSIEAVSSGEGRRIDSYLQLKTLSSEALKGKILIDSPGFDADTQRTATLVIADHIIDLSDLVLVFFDARHPEPGAMADTLKHLVGDAIARPDANKFLYILNQVDNTAREDNPEEVVAAWQRALAQHGLTAGRFYRSFARDVAIPIENATVRERLERKRDEDLEDIEARMRQVEIERAYRVVSKLEETALDIRDRLVPQVAELRARWQRNTNLLAAILLLPLALASTWFAWDAGLLSGLDRTTALIVGGLALLGVLISYHYLRRLSGYLLTKKLRKRAAGSPQMEAVARAFAWNRSAWWSLPGSGRPRGWGRRTRAQVAEVLGEADSFIQSLNDSYAAPSGKAGGAATEERAVTD